MMPPKKKDSSSQVSGAATRSKRSRGASSTETVRIDEGLPDVTSPNKYQKLGAAGKTKALKNIGNLDIPEEDEESADEESLDGEKKIESEAESASEASKANLLKDKKGKGKKHESEDSPRKLQLAAEASKLSKHLKKEIETKMKKSVSEKRMELSERDLKKLEEDTYFLANLEQILTASGNRATDDELNEAIALHRASPSDHMPLYTYFVRGIQKGKMLQNNKNEAEMKKVCDMFQSTLKKYNATQKALEKTQAQLDFLFFGDSKALVPYNPVPKESKVKSVGILPVKTEKKSKNGKSSKKGSKSDKSIFNEDDYIDVDEIDDKEEKKEIKVSFQNVGDYVKALRTTMSKILANIAADSIPDDFHNAAKEISDEEWQTISSKPSDEFTKKIQRMTKEKYAERIVKEQKKKDNEKEVDKTQGGSD